MFWQHGYAGKVLPHCRRVELIHIPKTSGQSFITALDAANASFCYTETYCSPMPNAPRMHEVRKRCGCSSCTDPHDHLEDIGVHEERFGSVRDTNNSILYLAVVREPMSWLRSAVGHVCGACPDLDACHHGNVSFWYHSQHHVHPPTDCKASPYGARNGHSFISSIGWFHTKDLQSHLLNGLHHARNWVVCTLESREIILRILEVASGRELGSGRNQTHVGTGAGKFGLPSRFDDALAAGGFEHLYRSDMKLYQQVAASPEGCIGRLSEPEWTRALCDGAEPVLRGVACVGSRR